MCEPLIPRLGVRGLRGIDRLNSTCHRISYCCALSLLVMRFKGSPSLQYSSALAHVHHGQSLVAYGQQVFRLTLSRPSTCHDWGRTNGHIQGGPHLRGYLYPPSSRQPKSGGPDQGRGRRPRIWVEVTRRLSPSVLWTPGGPSSGIHSGAGVQLSVRHSKAYPWLGPYNVAPAHEPPFP